MTTELENALTRELTDIADRVAVPPLPSMASMEQERKLAARRIWQPLLAAAVVLLVVGTVFLVAHRQDANNPQPMPSPSPSPSVTTSAHEGPIPVTAPSVPYVLDRQLYVDGTRVPGDDWGLVQSRGGTWVAQRFDGTWWAGAPGMDTGQIPAQLEQPPAISPNGLYVAFIDLSSGSPTLTGFDTFPAGEGFGSAAIDLPRLEDGIPLRVRAVTDTGEVIVQGTRTSLMWPAASTDERDVVDLNETAPDQVILQGTAAGLVVVEGANGSVDAADTPPYLADISADGQLTPHGTLPTYDDLEVSPGGTWLVRSPAGTLGGEVPSVSTLRAQPVGSSDETVLTAPEGWAFANNTWAWEDDDLFISVVLPSDGATQVEPRLARCSVTRGQCRLIKAGAVTPDTQGGSTAQETLDAVVRAVVAGDRAVLRDQSVVGDDEWDLLREFAGDGGGDGKATTCRDNGSGTKDCEIFFEADKSMTYYAILEPAKNAYGWRITYVGMADG